ncbi:RNA polymerase II degradation factor 1 [Drosophila ficusphila]|uniref:RNA polymerase II degradation factor 1 n=1 Tax=Drosophila ficusphila TaxID=30025 RepID=UPI0007E70FEF|nr:RNA polymerase II degradation factor 1 [Drosophila ficusphila]XP_017039424.1 RNA polymerase II degradation factor 1 [Drosophila ficusphila]
MAHFCWLLKLGFLLLMLAGCRTRPAPFPSRPQSELIAGNEFLKLFLDHDDQQRSLHSGEQDFEGRAGSPSPSTSPDPRQRAAAGRSLDLGRNRFRNSLSSGNSQDEQPSDSKQVAKLVTSGSKIVFLEDAPSAGKRKPGSDEVKVVAVSVSSSSKRGPPRISSTGSTGGGSDFVNRSHKSELSIEETEPRLGGGDSMDAEGDSLNSASNIQSVLAAPSLAASSSRSFLKNQSEVAEEDGVGTAAGAGLPFQTVIYHDSKQGRGPQSRSISYSSISQNVDDLQAWQQSRSGILAEAQRNVSESLKHGHSSEPAKFYSVPSKMYSVPSKFYSEPAKVYSEPAKMYGQPEKVYSEPSKVYGQPSKFYSEPAKVYSQPSKVYGEPAKTYWPQTLTTTAAPPPGSTSAPAATTSSTTEKPLAPTTFTPLRSRPRPAIVSRIAFGEAQSTSTTTAAPPSGTAATSSSTAAPLASRATTVKPPGSSTRPTTWQHHYHGYNHQQQQQQQQQHQQQQPAHPTRRVLFNLDKLPYDLLNAPQPYPLEPILSKHSSPSHYHQQHQQQQHEPQQQQQHQSPCWEQQRQHSSPPHQHSNQNAKGLPNRDLVKCVSKFAHQHGAAASAADPSAPSSSGSGGGYSYSSSSSSTSSSSSSSSSSAGSSVPKQPHLHQQQHQQAQKQHFTTERPELYTPTSEQNYEIEESVSVMTNGRAHGPQGGAGGASGAGSAVGQATTPASPAQAQAQAQASTTASGRGINRGRGSVVYNANANDYSDDEGEAGEAGDGGSEGPESPDDEDKVAYVVEGRNYRKYRVEEKTDDGFIVGEYGVVDHNDGNLWGVRYTADSTINRSLIQKALLTFLKLK